MIIRTPALLISDIWFLRPLRSMAEPLGPALDAVLDSFDSRVTALKSLVDLRGLSSSTSASTLEAAELQIAALEADVAAARGAIVSESALLAEVAELQRRAVRTTAELTSMSSRLPKLLPGDVAGQQPVPIDVSDSSRPPLAPLGGETASANHAGPSALPAPTASSSSSREAGGAASGRSTGGGSRRPPPPPLALVTEAELSTAPQYMRSRLDISKVNAALTDVQKLVASKYSLLCLTAAEVRKLPDADRRRHAALKAAEGGEATRGTYFFSEEDVKNLQTIKADATGKNLIAVLRHVGRLKEFKLGGQRCWRLEAR